MVPAPLDEVTADNQPIQPSEHDPDADPFARLVQIMARLRAPGGCPWDAEQTHSSLAIHLLEEAHEALDAIDRNDLPELAEELGDLLLQVVFHSEIAAEAGHFDVWSVVEGLTDKLIARHPHVFSDVSVSGSDEVVANWETLKAAHKQRTSLLEGIPESLPALLLAHKAIRRLAGAGAPVEPSADAARAALESFIGQPDPRSLGQVLFEIVALASNEGSDPEGALRIYTKALLDMERTDG